MLTILHVSDVHFGASDLKGEQLRITDALVEAARGHAWAPEICIFSGDLAFKADETEFRCGLEWLSRLIAPPWNANLFVVPGNHDVIRKRAPASLRLAAADEMAFSRYRNDFERELPHLDGYRQWHSNARATFGSRLLSDWTNPFGCHNSIEINGHVIHIIGLNTALLSFHNDDFKHLAQDVPTLNRLLANRKDSHDCVIAVGHHPLSWLAAWNEIEVDRLLRQDTGANLYLHGHQHEQAVTVLGSATGQNLATLEAGAAYQGSAWPQFFAFYQLDFERREINSQTFLYSPNAGEWILDLSRSLKVVAPIPLPRRPSPSRRQEIAVPESGTPLRLDGALASEVEIIELNAWRAVDYANRAQALVYNYLAGDTFLEGIQYSRNSRIKSVARIVEKVMERRKKGDNIYSVHSLADICGFRIVTLFQSGIPLIIDRLLRAIPSSGVVSASPLRRGNGVGVTVHTSRPSNDPLSIVEPVRDTILRWDGSCPIDVRSRGTGYSSVHLVIYCSIREGSTEQVVPVEFQIRSILEEVWGQLDHKLRYGISRGGVGGTRWQLHLNALKTHFDACIQYIDLIKLESEERDNPPEPKMGTSDKTVDPPQKELERLKGLPAPLHQQLQQAYELWKKADATRSFGNEPGLYRMAADAFAPFVDGRSSEVGDETLSAQLSYTARMERAYLLMFTGDPQDLVEARTTYEGIIHDRSGDGTANFRLGQVLRRQGESTKSIELLEGSIQRLEEAVRIIERRDDWRLRPDEGWVYDAARLNLGLAHFRIFERRELADGRRHAALKSAIDCSRQVVERHLAAVYRRRAVNDLLYYAWEERNGWRDTSDRFVPDELFQKLLAELDEANEAEAATSYEQYDTLCRAHHEFGNRFKAITFARMICDWLENAAIQRSKGALKLPEPQHGPRWMKDIMRYLPDDDEQDSLTFALEVLTSAGPNGVATGEDKVIAPKSDLTGR